MKNLGLVSQTSITVSRTFTCDDPYIYIHVKWTSGEMITGPGIKRSNDNKAGETTELMAPRHTPSPPLVYHSHKDGPHTREIIQ